MKTFVTSEDVADMILFLCSKAGSKISGQAIGIDGNIEILR
jgi:NAD(P)-dependent dehydrogenase (short-subunit alcohol dehydrogenase family)